MRFRASLLAFAVALIATAGAADDDGKLLLTVQIRPGASAQTLATLARIGVEDRIVTSEPTTVRALLTSTYGFSHQRFRDLFARYNRSLKSETIASGTEVTIPAAPKWYFNVPRQTNDELNAIELAKLDMGVTGPKTRASIANANRVALASLPSIRGGDVVTLPYVVPFVSIEVKPEYRAKVASIARKMMADDPSVQFAEVSRPWRLIDSLATASKSQDGSAAGPSFVRPLPADDFVAKLPRGHTTIAVVDSGIANDDPRFDNLWSNPRLDPSGNDLDFRYLWGDRFGFDFVNRRGIPTDDITDQRLLNHGTHVAGIATQRLAPKPLRKVINDRVDLMVLKVADRDGFVAAGAVQEGVVFAAERKARIVNMSFAGAPSMALDWIINRAPNVLFVVAAGNEKIDADVDEKFVYPAKFSAKYPNVIAVAAADSEMIASFSNYGANTIDIAAPGIDIESTVAGGTARLSGSSQAAPLVSYVAALLSSSGFRSPEGIRRRIINSVDVVPALRGKVASEGLLDAQKALSFATDVVELADRSLLYGTVTAPSRVVLPDGKEATLAAIRKIVIGYSNDPAAALRVTWDDGAAQRTAATRRSFDSIRIVQGGVEKVFPAVQVRDIVRASVP